MVYVEWCSTVPGVYRDRPDAWRDHLDKFLEPRLTPEEQAEREVAEAAAEAERFEAEWEQWGTSPEALASQATLIGMFGAEG